MEEYQSAYRADHSTETALLKVHHDISSALDESHAVALVILDLSAAFDTIDQCQLLSLLNEEFGVHAKALSWLETYLEARAQRVKIDDAMSETIPLTCGVPQGSVLEPVLFTIYTMPMQRIIRKHGVVYHKYADDTQLYVTYKPNVLGDMQRAVKQLGDCISEIRVWMINRMLKLNDNKADMVIYMSQYHLNKYGRCDISIGDSTISPVECVRNLGVQIDQHLTMDKQVTAVCKACNFHLYRLSSIRRYITTDGARSVVQALITSRLDYCNSLLANLTNTQMKRLKSIQHKAARLVTRTPLREHITPVLKHLHWLPVECRITYKLMVLVYKSISSLSDCLTDISLWMKSSKLKLNSDKTEFIIIGTKQQRQKLSNHFPVKLLDNDISPSDSVRNLGVIFDSDFSFHKHVSNICKSCFYHIRDLRRIQRHIPLSTAKTISNALISSRLDYCNSLINNIAKQDLSKLQRVQNCLARVILRAPRFSPSLPLLKQLHWLPVNYRIKFKLCTLTFRALAIHQPPYLASLLHFSNIPRQLRSSTSQQLSIPRTKLNLGKRAFSVAAPIIWNELPTTLKSCESLASFRKNLKTYLFKIAFPP